MKIQLEPFILLFLLALAPALAFGSTWTTSYGGSANDYAYSIQETSDNGFIVAGRTTSYGAGFFDYWVLRLDANGNVVWQKTYGGSSYDYAYSIQETLDGGFIVAGYIDPYSLLIYDFWVLKLGANGNVVWQKTYGGSIDEIAYSIQETSDSGFIVAGRIDSDRAGNNDYWVLKLDSNGSISNCNLIQDTSVVTTNSDATIVNTNASPQASIATVTNTSVEPTITDAAIEQQCFYNQPPLTEEEFPWIIFYPAFTVRKDKQ